VAEPVTIRDAAEADVQAIARVHVAAWRESYAGLIRPDILAGLSVEDRGRMWRSALAEPRPGFRLLVAETGGAVVGLGAAGPARPGLLGTEAEIFALYLLDRIKRRGVGRRMMAGLLGHLREAGFGFVGLWAFADNAPACRFYEALGAARGEAQGMEFGGQRLVEIAYRFEPIPEL
jgi:ribosomal protein S18 acetylase RimI-like enzyme